MDELYPVRDAIASHPKLSEAEKRNLIGVLGTVVGDRAANAFALREYKDRARDMERERDKAEARLARLENPS